MSAKRIRSLVVVAAFVLLPGATFAQCIEQCTSCVEAPDNGCRFVFGWEDRSCACEEWNRGLLHRFFCDNEWYVSWGASREVWGNTNIHVNQSAIGSNFTVYNVRGVDDPTWNSLFGGQFNIRVGRFIDQERTWAIEFALDHTKYTSRLGQFAHVAGTINGQPVDATLPLTNSTFDYKLHNGANHAMINLVKRVPLCGEVNETGSLAFIGKFGLGAVVPHAENTIFLNPVDVGQKTPGNILGFNRGWWQFNGWTTGVEFGLRYVFCKPFYIDVTDKVAFAALYNVPVYQGTARHNLWMNEFIVSVGVTFGARNAGY